MSSFLGRSGYRERGASWEKAGTSGGENDGDAQKEEKALDLGVSGNGSLEGGVSGSDQVGEGAATDGRIGPGCSYSSQNIPAKQVPADMFRLRVGPNYGRKKKKEPSGEALYDIAAVDICKVRMGGGGAGGQVPTAP